MNATAQPNGLPEDVYLLSEPGFADPDDENRPNRLCICFSDVHFTDGTVGVQSADDVVWEEVFDTIMDLAVDNEIEELNLILVGDVADMIRTGLWAANQVYPWQRDHLDFKRVLGEVMEGVIGQHARPPTPGGKTGFFYLLRQLPDALAGYEYRNKNRKEHKKSRVKKVRTLVLLGNHDKEILADDQTLKRFYEECLGQPVESLSDDYRRWIGKMYFGDENKYLDPERKSVPWLPFYWGDAGFRLFVTHGQWRDPDNSRRIQGTTTDSSWRVCDGWQPKRWRNMGFAPFTEPCFGDTVAAGVLSGFIYWAKEELKPIEKKLRESGQLGQADSDAEKALSRLKRVLDELDLYRPTAAAVGRVIEETRRLRKMDHSLGEIRTKIETVLLESVHAWLDWEFTLASARPAIRMALRIARPVVNFLKRLGVRVELWSIYALMSLVAWLQQGQRNAPSYCAMRKFPAFLEAYRSYGFRIHGEGHTHIPLQEELYFEKPKDRRNYTYINFGAWRDQVVPKLKRGYRRRGVGRALVVLDTAGGADGQRHFAYWVEDVLSWGDTADRLD